MIRKIIGVSNPILTRPAAEVEKFETKHLVTLVDDLFETMKAASGIGLAAPQIAESVQVTVVQISKHSIPYTLINPLIIWSTGYQVGEEGCLSIPKLRLKIMRPFCVTVNYKTITGKEEHASAEGLLAAAFCHEIDHLNGILITDRALKQGLGNDPVQDYSSRF